MVDIPVFLYLSCEVLTYLQPLLFQCPKSNYDTDSVVSIRESLSKHEVRTFQIREEIHGHM